MKKIIVWGLGDRTDKYLKFNYFDKAEILGFVDKNKMGSYNGYKIFKPEQIYELSLNIDYIVISTFYFSEIYAYCLEHKVSKDKIIITDQVEEAIFDYNLIKLREISSKIQNELYLNRYKFIKMNEKDTLDPNRCIGKGRYKTQDYFSDYFRYRTFEYVADYINENNIEGELAEFGVFRGIFSSLISEKFPDKEIYLFDTFEGFNEEEASEEMSKQQCNEEFIYAHKRTSDAIILDNMPYPNRVHIIKGLFPESVLEEHKSKKYAFVSIDVDFEESIYSGLEFFYPRLSNGGYIFLHDYNSAFLHGVKNAVRRYESDNGIRIIKVPIADRAGTLIITK